MSEEDKGVWVRIVDQLLAWIKQVGGTALVLAIVRFYKRKAWYAERKSEQDGLKLKHHENEEKVEKNNHGKSDIDIVHDAISEGSRLRNGDSNGSAE